MSLVRKPSEAVRVLVVNSPGGVRLADHAEGGHSVSAVVPRPRIASVGRDDRRYLLPVLTSGYHVAGRGQTGPWVAGG